MADPQYVSIPELARRLGITRAAAHRHVAAGRIPAVRLGRTYHVRVDALDTLADLQAAERREAHGGGR